MNEERLKTADEEASPEEYGSRVNSLRKTVEKHGIYDERDATWFEESLRDDETRKNAMPFHVTRL